MNSHDNLIQIIFHYTNGQTESFNVGSVTPQELQQQIAQVLAQSWCLLHLPEQTVCINTANVLKVEIKPALREMQGANIFADVRRVTALSRSASR